LDETRHGLEDGDFVTFTEVQGMEELNGCKPRKVTVKGPYTFTIGDTSDLSDYVRGGIFTQVKMPKIIEFVSYCISIISFFCLPYLEILSENHCQLPELFITDFAKVRSTSDSSCWVPSSFAVQQEKTGDFLAPRNAEDASAVVALAKKTGC
jgi:ubiquitin-activating enzyme E1